MVLGDFFNMFGVHIITNVCISLAFFTHKNWQYKHTQKLTIKTDNITQTVQTPTQSCRKDFILFNNCTIYPYFMSVVITSHFSIDSQVFAQILQNFRGHLHVAHLAWAPPLEQNRYSDAENTTTMLIISITKMCMYSDFHTNSYHWLTGSFEACTPVHLKLLKSEQTEFAFDARECMREHACDKIINNVR